ncbi:MAG: LptF/LptG family permease, partial [Alphaproteobacteria bacterium]|nr:LptF/LptG family permease [Alphaproteobacteria bacterium]
MRSLVSIIFFRIFRTTVYSTAALTFCAWIVQSSRYLDMLNTHNISLAKFFKFTSYLSVDIIAIILPIALAISAAFVYQRFKESNQLVALQAAGISPREMLRPLVSLSMIAICYLYASNFYISPHAWHSFRSLEFEIKNNIEPPESAGVIFSNNKFSVYAQTYAGKLHFRNIFIIDSRSSNKSTSYFAKLGVIKNNTLYLNNGEQIEIDFSSHRSSAMSFASYSYDLKQILNSKKKTAQPNEKFANELLEDSENTEQVHALRA